MRLSLPAALLLGSFRDAPGLFAEARWHLGVFQNEGYFFNVPVYIAIRLIFESTSWLQACLKLAFT